MSSHESSIDFIDSNSLLVNNVITTPSIVNPAHNSLRLTSIEGESDLLESSANNVQRAGSSSNHRQPKPTKPLEWTGVEIRGDATTRVFTTPGGSLFYKPSSVPDDFKPVLDSKFSNWNDVKAMYNRYAAAAGFGTKQGTNKQRTETNTYRFMHCERYGKPKLGDASMATRKRKRSSRMKVNDCPAVVRFIKFPGTTDYVLYEWIEVHNHPLICKEFADYSSKQRKVTFTEQQLVHNLSKHNIGLVKAHKIQSTLKGGQEYVRGKTVDFKNIQRNIRLFINDRDAQLTVDALAARIDNRPNFFFDYKAENNEIKALFWADGVSRCNYEAFGDVLAFDATYKTNKYKMIFVPFTGVDHHKRCVTFSAGLICDETVDSYVWLLETFLKAHSRHPRLVLTDQDGAMRKAVLQCFPNSAHRLCMWHIMKKLPNKMQGSDVDNSELRRRIHELVWDVLIETSDFESRWVDLISEYQLEDHEWLSEMYLIRERWIPCYFRHLDMCCLMKTTSRCESSNAMFKVNTNPNNTLLQFLICFDTALDGQRSKQRDLEYAMQSSVPRLYTPLRIEKYASEIYTPYLFREVQIEIHRGMLTCQTVQTSTINDVQVHSVAQYDTEMNYVCNHQVTFDTRTKTSSCTCMLFTRIGYLCRHVFCVYRYAQQHVIPEQYMSKRWTRDALPKSVHDASHRYSSDNSEETRLRNEIIDTVCECATHLRRNPTQLSALCDQLKQLKIKIFSEVPSDPEANRTNAIISDLLGVPETGTATLTMPKTIRTKGCGTEKGSGSGKRFVGPDEQARNRAKKGKAPRRCGTCNTVTNHNKRTCEKVQAAKQAAAAAKAAKSLSSGAVTSGDTNVDSSSLADDIYSGLKSLFVSRPNTSCVVPDATTTSGI